MTLKRFHAALAVGLAISASGALAAPTSDQTSPEITARAWRGDHSGWLTTARQPDGSVRAWIEVADLDASTPAGWQAMARRVEMGTSTLCDQAQEEPQLTGFFNPGQRACRTETRSQAADQMNRAREAARRGERVSVLGLSRSESAG